MSASNEEIERALENLGTKGKIKIELRAPEQAGEEERNTK